MQSAQSRLLQDPFPSTRTKGMKRRVVLAAGLAAPFLPRFARAAEFTWRVGHGAPVDFALHLRLVEAAGTIARQSGGQMTVEIHGNSELGSAIGLLAQVRAGTIDVAPLTSQVLANDLSLTAMPMAGFVFSGYDQLWSALDGAAGAYIRARLKDRLSLVTMDRCWDFGFRQITTTDKTINTAADIVGLKLRTPPEADFVGLLQALKALPVTLPLNMLEKTLASHYIDGQDSVLPLVQAAGLFRVQTLCALTNHIWDGAWMCVSGKSWSKLPAKLQDIVAAALNESGLHQRQDIADADQKTRKALEAEGMKFNTVDPKTFRAALRGAGYYAAWQSRVGDDAWATLEKYTGRLT
jgi:TRAP-type C4-dicarboxylate transport system substrate-binding protein